MHAGEDTPHTFIPTDEPNLIGPGGKVDRSALFALYEQTEGDDEHQVTVHFTLSRDLNKRHDKYLVDRIPFIPRPSLPRPLNAQALLVPPPPPTSSPTLRLG